MVCSVRSTACCPDDGSQLLLLIDQFEELYTQVDPATANRFLANLVSAVTDEQSRIRVVATLRADFYDRPLQHRDLGELLRNGTEVVTPMTAHDLEHAITCPAEPYGITFEPAVVAALVREVTDRPGALPLLQYTLTELFDHRRGNRIDLATYEELGGVSGTLVKRAEGLLASLGDEAHEVARQVFLRLVTFNEGGEDTRRRVLQSELEDLDVDRLRLRAVLETFGRHRLLSFDRDPITRSPTVEISHEALLTEWTRLRNWIDGARDDVRVQRRLAEAMREWIAADRDDAYLLRGGLLEQVHGWVATTSVQLSAPEHAFLGASLVERDREAEELLATRAARGRGRAPPAAARSSTARRSASSPCSSPRSRCSARCNGARPSMPNATWKTYSRWSVWSPHPPKHVRTILSSPCCSPCSRCARPSTAAMPRRSRSMQCTSRSRTSESSTTSIGETPVAVRSGPGGPVGVYALAPSELMQLAESTVQRDLTDEECQAFLSRSCRAEVDIPEDLELRGGVDSYGVRSGPRALEGTTVSINWGVGDRPFERQLAAFTERTGIAVELRSNEVEDVITFADEPNRRPDVLSFGAVMPDWVEGQAIDIGRFVEPEVLRSDFGEYLLSVGASDTVGGALPDGPIRAIPLKLDVKDLVYYPKAEFEQAGYQVPTTWAELLALSDRIVADGRTPWCFAFESDAASGWPGTDLVESLVLRHGGVDNYDAWTRGEIGFSNPVVIEAGRLADALVLEPGYARGGTAAIRGEYIFDQLDHMLIRDDVTGDIEPECWLHLAPNYLLSSFVPSDVRIGTDIDFFMLPPVDPSRPTPVEGSAGFVSAMVDRPEVRALMEFVASPQWGEDWAGDPFGDFISPNRRFDRLALR